MDGWDDFKDYYQYKRYLIKKYLKTEKYENIDMFLKLIFSNDVLPQLKYRRDLYRVLFGESKSYAANLRRWLSCKDEDEKDRRMNIEDKKVDKSGLCLVFSKAIFLGRRS